MSTAFLQPKSRAKRPPSVKPEQRCLRVLVVDDSPFILKAICEILEQQTDVLLVGTAFDGIHAVKRVMELEPDLVLMDVQMSGMNGLEATRLMKGGLHPPAVILVTIEDTPEHRAAAQAVGADDLISTPYLFSNLVAVIRRIFPGVAA